MRRKDKTVTDIEVLHQVIHKAQVCRLGLADGTEPYIVPLSFGFDGTHIYFHSAAEGRKIGILRRNNRVCVEFEQDVSVLKGEKPCKWSFRYLTVIGRGMAEPVGSFQQKTDALNLILKHYDPQWIAHSFTEQELSSVLVFKIVLEEVTGKASGITF